MAQRLVAEAAAGSEDSQAFLSQSNSRNLGRVTHPKVQTMQQYMSSVPPSHAMDSARHRSQKLGMKQLGEL